MDALRGIAALLVVAGHVRALTACDWSALSAHNAIAFLFYSVTHMGTEAVSAFFVLSGYWIGGHLLRSFQDGTFMWAVYLTQRTTRLFIVLIPALGVTSIATVGALSVFKGAPIFHDSALSSSVVPQLGSESWSPWSLIGSLLFLQPTVAPAPALNGPLWTLGLEFWCYLLAPAILAIASRRTVVMSLVTAVVASFMLVGGGAGYPALWTLGVLVAKYPRFGVCARLVSSEHVRIVLSGVILMGAALASSLPEVPGFASLAITGIATADFIASSASTKSVGVESRAVRLGAWVGGFSYSLYLVHLPLLVATVAAMHALFGFHRTDNVYFAVTLLLVGIAGAVASAYVFFGVFEARTNVCRDFIVRRLRIAPMVE